MPSSAGSGKKGKGEQGTSNKCPGVWCNPCFILKLIAVALLIAVIVMAFVVDGTYSTGDSRDEATAANWNFVIACGGGTFILLVLIIGYSCSSVSQVVDVLFVLVLCCMCVAAGAIAIHYAKDSWIKDDGGIPAGILLLIAAAVLLIDGIVNLAGKGGG